MKKLSRRGFLKLSVAVIVSIPFVKIELKPEPDPVEDPSNWHHLVLSWDKDQGSRDVYTLVDGKKGIALYRDGEFDCWLDHLYNSQQHEITIPTPPWVPTGWTLPLPTETELTQSMGWALRHQEQQRGLAIRDFPEGSFTAEMWVRNDKT